MRLAATLEYDGTEFSGFQRQNNAETIQEHLEVSLKKITNENLRNWQRSIGYVPQHIYLLDDTIINNIAFDSYIVDINIADSQLYSPYITNRYLTSVNPQVTHLVNNTVNKYGIVFNSLDHYKFLFHLVPKSKRKFIRYIKKKKTNI